MPSINQLNAVDTLNASDLFVVWSSNNGDSRKASGTVVADFVQSMISVADNKLTQYASPAATGFDVTIENLAQSTWLILTPVAGYAAGTITLPPMAYALDKQEILVNTTQSVTTLTVDGNGAGVVGAPTTLAANAFFRLRFDAVMKNWYRVG